MCVRGQLGRASSRNIVRLLCDRLEAQAVTLARITTERDRLREGLQRARQFIVRHVCVTGDVEAFRVSQTRNFREVVAAIDTALNGEKRS